MSLTILIVDDEEHFRQNIEAFLTSREYEAIGVGTLEEAKRLLDQGAADIILLDVQLPDGYGPDLLESTMRMPARPPIIMITAYGDVEMAVSAMKNGAHDFIQKPIKFERLEQSIERAGEVVAMRRELEHYRQAQQQNLDDFYIGGTPAMKAVVDLAARAANHATSVLITGETGTGKEVLANAIHQMGIRSDKPFIAQDFVSVQDTMFENTLFGHEPGAYTDAKTRKHGLMEIADGGILFLDEIAAMPQEMQVKLLRALEERAFRRVGGNKLIRVDVQVIAASNWDLPALIEDGKFRQDLYYRLKVVDLHLPPLRERQQDIPELVGRFIKQLNLRMGLNITDVTPRAMEALVNHSWPGNIRELKNALERAMLFCDGAALDIQHLPADISQVPA